MPNFLKTIIEQKTEEVKRLRKTRSGFNGRTDSPRGFQKSLKKNPGLALVAEVKKASPSRGLISPDFDPEGSAKAFEAGGADSISVLTDERFFMGSNEYLKRVRQAVSLPVLRKDFIIDPVQVEEAASLNADAVLLIAAALSDGQMEELYSAALEAKIDPLVEIHNSRELDRSMRLEPLLIGINNRDLETFNVDINTTITLRPHIPHHIAVISESGVFSQGDTSALIGAGVDAVLVGESLMRADDPGELIRRLKHLQK